uniref:Uncharacterized protein n=1 Tax=Panagrolaimus davidi TaxID=227884 RepID=A0A914PKT6_9BILA
MIKDSISDSEVNNFDDNHATIDFDVCKSDHFIDDKYNSDAKPCTRTPLWIHKRIQNSNNRFLSLSQPTLQKLYQAPILKPLKRIEIPFQNKTKKEDRLKHLQQRKLSSKMKFKAFKNESSSEEEKEDHSIEFGTEFNRKKISTTLPPETEAPTTDDLMPSSTEPSPIENDEDEEIDTEDHSVDFGGECDFDPEVEEEEGEAPSNNANSNSNANSNIIRTLIPIQISTQTQMLKVTVQHNLKTL